MKFCSFKHRNLYIMQSFAIYILSYILLRIRSIRENTVDSSCMGNQTRIFELNSGRAKLRILSLKDQIKCKIDKLLLFLLFNLKPKIQVITFSLSLLLSITRYNHNIKKIALYIYTCVRTVHNQIFNMVDSNPC
jgi:hypothetical protein